MLQAESVSFQYSRRCGKALGRTNKSLLVHDFLHAAYAEAWLSNTLITLAHCADGVNLESADPTTRRKWKAFAKKLGHGQILDMSKADVEAQLRDRADTLQGFRLDMRQAVLDLTTQMTQASKT